MAGHWILSCAFSASIEAIMIFLLKYLNVMDSIAPRILVTYRRLTMSQFEKLPSCHVHALVEHLNSFSKFSVIAGLLGAHTVHLSGCWQLCCHPIYPQGIRRLMCWGRKKREHLLIYVFIYWGIPVFTYLDGILLYQHLSSTNRSAFFNETRYGLTDWKAHFLDRLTSKCRSLERS